MKTDIIIWLLISEEKSSVFHQTYIRCVFFIEDFYQVKEVLYYSEIVECFYHDRVLKIVNFFSTLVEMIIWVFFLYSIKMMCYSA